MDSQRTRKQVSVWLGIVCASILLLIVIGGVTRLTGSGLSITRWQPITGVIPPLSESSWIAEFEAYKATPQAQMINSWMGLEDFKFIYFWEWFHRFVARSVGVIFLLPWLFFIWRGKTNRKFNLRMGGAFILGGLQGALGWYMVKSGLEVGPYVSHYRLTAHLLLAFFLLGLLFKTILELNSEPHPGPKGLSLAWVLYPFFFIQLILGAFSSGLRAGTVSNTFPSMNGEWVPTGIFAIAPVWANFLENPLTIQFFHRSLGWAFAVAAIALWVRSRKLHGKASRPAVIFAGVVFAQFLLGVLTVVLHVPVAIAAIHQLGGAILFLSLLTLDHSGELRLRDPKGAILNLHSSPASG